MSLTEMYPAKNNSPSTVLSADISSESTTMTVENAAVLPAAPNIAVIGNSDEAEIIKYTAIDGNTLTIIRGVNGTTPGTWTAGTAVARNFTAQDHEAFRENIIDLDTRKANTDDVYTQTEIDTALAEKAPLANPALTGTPTAPTASSGTSTTQIATTAYVRGEVSKEILYFYQQAVSAANSAQIMRIADSRITANTVVLACTFANPDRITSAVSWTSSAGAIVFTGTCTAATTANVTLGQKGN